MEKAIYFKIANSGIFNTGDYQQGFKTGGSCGVDHARLLSLIDRESKLRKHKRSIITLIDITMAFDSIDRTRLWSIVDRRLARKIQEARDKGEPTDHFDAIEAVITLSLIHI